MKNSLNIINARENNLKNISLEIPHDCLTVITGVSGSGKSSLAFDTVYAEGQRRYIETFSPYTRQFFDKVKKPQVDSITNLRPAVAVEQKVRITSSRSTVGSLSNINDYLKVLFAEASAPCCLQCHKPLLEWTSITLASEISKSSDFILGVKTKVEKVKSKPNFSKFDILGFSRWYDQKDHAIKKFSDEKPKSDEILLIVDRIGKKADSLRLKESLELALNLGKEICLVKDKEIISYKIAPECCGTTYDIPAKTQSLFNPSSAIGACINCKGFGYLLVADPKKVVPDENLSIKKGAISCWDNHELTKLTDFCKKQGISTDLPWKELDQKYKDWIFNGHEKFRGINPWFKLLERKTYKVHVRTFLAKYRTQVLCPECEGSRLNKKSLIFRLNDYSLKEIYSLPIKKLSAAVDIKKYKNSSAIQDLSKDLNSRIKYMMDLGLGYLTLNRPSRTLSGGETQRVNLVGALGSELSNTQFVLDEPSVGLHPRDSENLLHAIRNLSRNGNSVLVVEHDPEFILNADHIIEVGEKAGAHGGNIVFNDTADKWKSTFEFFEKTPLDPGEFLPLRSGNLNNLKDFKLKIALNSINCITGVSGSGKSSLSEVIIENLSKDKGFKHVELIDQSSLARSPRSNIATYTGIWDRARTILAETELASKLKLTKSHFSFNVDGGRCNECKGAGFIKEDMQFLSDVYLECETCGSKRFKRSILEVTYKGKNVSDLLALTVEEAAEFFEHKDIVKPSQILINLGLGYLTLGQSLSQLSGGEAQRLKLVPYLQGSDAGNNLLIFDEPSTGLHVSDINNLITVFDTLVAQNNTIIIVEHNLQIINQADWIIDLGPEAGDEGGSLVYQGNVKGLLKTDSLTAKYLKRFNTKYVKTYEKNLKANLPTTINIIGARENNLKNISVQIHLNQLTAITGLSGSGKSTIAKDILYAEGQRKYLDVLSPFARQFITELKRPKIDKVQHIPPSICVYQHTFQPNHLSTVGTMSEVYSYLRLLFTKTGKQYCSEHPNQSIQGLTAAEIVEEVLKFNTQIRLLAPIIKNRKGEHRAIIDKALALGFTEIRHDGHFAAPQKLTEGLEKNKQHNIEYVIARFNPKSFDKEIINDCVKQALSLGENNLIICADQDYVFSSERSCPICKKGYLKIDPEELSFQSKKGRCETCDGTGNYKGKTCPDCNGTRLNKLADNLKLNDKTIHEMSKFTAPELLKVINSIKFEKIELTSSLIDELKAKLQTLVKLGLDYISLNRSCNTLSNGELQRLRISSAVGSPLSGVQYIFDEPSAGLHPNDNLNVIEILKELKNRKNTVILIEHDPISIRSCERVLEIGPGAGRNGGEIVFDGTIKDFKRNNSLTSKSLNAKLKFNEVPYNKENFLSFECKEINNLKNFSVTLPLNNLITVAGVSGVGKSSLVNGIASTIIDGDQTENKWKSKNSSVQSDLKIDRVLIVDQKPIGINSRSTPASYLGLWDEIRKTYANTVEAKSRGWTHSYFSYNSGKGRCQTCMGVGELKLELNFLPDAKTICPDCNGKRFSIEADTVKYLGYSISQVLNLTFEEAKNIFANHRKIYSLLKFACDLGLGYLTIGQSSKTLSGGESQRIKLVSELAKPARGHTLYVLDEPSTGLHRIDVEKLISSLKTLVSNNNTVLVIEHDADLIAASDYLIELGDGPQEKGGKIIYQGSVSKDIKSPWGQLLAKLA